MPVVPVESPAEAKTPESPKRHQHQLLLNLNRWRNKIKISRENNDYICLTDIARFQNPIEPKDVVCDKRAYYPVINFKRTREFYLCRRSRTAHQVKRNCNNANESLDQ